MSRGQKEDLVEVARLAQRGFGGMANDVLHTGEDILSLAKLAGMRAGGISVDAVVWTAKTFLAPTFGTIVIEHLKNSQSWKKINGTISSDCMDTVAHRRLWRAWLAVGLPVANLGLAVLSRDTNIPTHQDLVNTAYCLLPLAAYTVDYGISAVLLRGARKD